MRHFKAVIPICVGFFASWGVEFIQLYPQVICGRGKPGLRVAFCLCVLLQGILVITMGFTYSFPATRWDFQCRTFLDMETCWIIVTKTTFKVCHMKYICMLKLKTTVKELWMVIGLETHMLLWLLFWAPLKDPARQILLEFKSLQIHQLQQTSLLPCENTGFCFNSPVKGDLQRLQCN